MNKKLFESIWPGRKEIKPTSHEVTEKVLEQALESIDLAKLQNAFDERLKPYGIMEKRSLLPRDQINFNLSPEEKSIAVYRHASQMISISPYWVEKRFESVDMRVATCMVQCHEQTHHLSHRECSLISDTEEQTITRTLIGLDEHYLQKIKTPDPEKNLQGSTRLFTFLNEGLTEMFSREILREYLKQDGGFTSQDKVDDFFHKLPQLELAYNKIIPTIEKMIDTVASKVGVSYDTVKESLYAAMFRGEVMSNEDIMVAFDELLGEGFMEKLAYQGVRDDQAELTHHLSQQ